MTFPFNLNNGLSTPPINVPPDRRDLLDYNGSNTIQSSRYINPETHDFEVSSDNLLQGMNAVNQQVLLAVNTTFNTSVLNGFGQDFSSIKIITPNIRNQVLSVLNQALSNLINNGLISIETVSINNNAYGQISVNFNYVNNTTGVSTPIQFNL